MNRAERRRAQARARKWHEDMSRFTVACGGTLQVFAVTPSNFHSLMAGVERGDPSLQAVCVAVSKWLCEALPNGRPVCLDCDVEFGSEQVPGAFIVSVPFANPIGAIVSGVCMCCLEHSDLHEMVLRRSFEMFPGSYEIPQQRSDQ